MKNQCSINNADKKFLRAEMKRKRQEISDEFVNLQSEIICEKIYEKVSDFDSILCYLSFNNEVKLDLLIKKLLNNGKIVSVPVCIDDVNMVISQIKSDIFNHKKNKYGIIEPKEIIKPEKGPQVCIVPGICFDLNKNRVGYGKGYYDRFFSKNNLIKIGTCFDFQIVDSIITSKCDVKMDYIITQKRIF